jgi:hypothetical protein
VVGQKPIVERVNFQALPTPSLKKKERLEKQVLNYKEQYGTLTAD